MRIAVLLVCVAQLIWAQAKGTIEGSVANKVTHEAIAGARVSWMPVGSAALGKPDSTRRAVTDSSGAFRTSELEPGDYEVHFEADDYVPVVRQPLRVAGGTVKLNVELAPSAAVRGRVLDEEGHPAAEVRIELYQYRGGRRNTAESDRDGRFVLTRLDAGGYAIVARPAAKPKDGTVFTPVWFPGFPGRAQAERIVVRPGADLSGYEIRLRRVPAWKVRGKAVDEGGKPVQGAVIRLRPSDEWAPDEGTVSSGADGVFEFASVRPGEWRLRASLGDTSEGFAAVTVEKHDVERVEVRLSPPFTLSGFVDREEPRDGGGKRKVSGVFLTPVGGQGSQVLAFHEQDGTIQFKKVQPGRYVIFPVTYLPGYYVESVKLGEREVMSKAVDLTSGAIPFRITYKPNAGRVHGTVEKGTGSTVVLLPQDEALLDGQFIRSAKCDANGHFEVGSLKPGEYYAFAFDRVDHDALEDVTFVRNLRSVAVLVHVEAGQAADTELKVTAWPE